MDNIRKVVGIVLMTLVLSLATIVMAEEQKVKAPSSPYQNDEHTVLLMHFDEGKGLPQDNSDFANHAVKNDATWVKEGKFGSCLYFDGKSYVTIPDSESLNIKDGEITIEAWIKPESYEGTYPAVLNKYTGQGGYFLGAIGKIYALSFLLRKDMETSGGISSDGPYPNPPFDEWSYVVVVKDKEGIVRMYVNGVKQSKEGKCAFTFASDKTPLTIGGYGGDHFKGFIDEVRISNIARW